MNENEKKNNEEAKQKEYRNIFKYYSLDSFALINKNIWSARSL